MSRWSPALRIARRTVRMSLGRSLLIAVLVGLPVAGATFVDVLVRTFSDSHRAAYQELGPADGMAVITAQAQLTNFQPTPYGGFPVQSGRHRRAPSSVDLTAELPAGSTWTDVPRTYETRLSLGGDRIIRPQLVVADAASPLTANAVQLVSGSLPEGADDVLVTSPLAERLGLLDSGGSLVDNASVTVADGPTVHVTGLAQAPFCLDCEEVVAVPGSTMATTAHGVSDYLGTPGHAYLVDLPDPADAATLWPTLARKGIAFTPRDVYLHPERYGQGGGISLTTPSALRAAALALLVTGLGLLEVVLLAGTAFAVGARRQVHDLGVVGASGATSRQIRRIVLAQGLVLGVLGSLIGICFGVAVAIGGRHLWERLDNGIVFGWNFGPGEIAVAAVVGAVSGVLAAVVPAIGAGRMTAVDALSGRFRVSAASKRRTPILGMALVLIGVATGVVGDQLMAADFAGYVRSLSRVGQTGSYVTPPSPTVPVGLVLLGAVLAVVGMVVLAPVIITALGRLAGGLPLSGRLAFRDAARHRHRTGPATSAIAVAVAGSVVFAFVLAGRAEADRLSYAAYLPPDVLSVAGAKPSDKALVLTAADQAATKLPDATVITPRYVTDGAANKPRQMSEIYASPPQRRCRQGCVSLPVALADTGLMELALGRPVSDAEAAALNAGKVLVVSSRLVDQRGEVHFDGGRRGARLPAVLAKGSVVYAGLPGAFVSADEVDAVGWATVQRDALIPFAASASKDQVDAAKTAVEEQGGFASLDTGPSDPSRILLVIAGIAAAFVTLVGVAISVALSAAEGKADLATLAAVGAPPRRRRSLAAAQALLVGGLGCGLGLLLGVFVSYTLRATIGAPQFVVPWNSLIVVGVVVPVLAMLIAAVFTPSRLPLTTRRAY